MLTLVTAFMLESMALATPPHDVEPILSFVSSEVMRFDSPFVQAHGTDLRPHQLPRCNRTRHRDLRMPSFWVSLIPLSIFPARLLGINIPQSFPIQRTALSTPAAQSIVPRSIKSEILGRLELRAVWTPLLSREHVARVRVMLFSWHV
jgi:hypothetical protein